MHGTVFKPAFAHKTLDSTLFKLVTSSYYQRRTPKLSAILSFNQPPTNTLPNPSLGHLRSATRRLSLAASTSSSLVPRPDPHAPAPALGNAASSQSDFELRTLSACTAALKGASNASPELERRPETASGTPRSRAFGATSAGPDPKPQTRTTASASKASDEALRSMRTALQGLEMRPRAP
ncbi:hypothetical protein B0H15DRAFT_950519 [Mycena belliarum]|uniref:Uncharacterized protein n=1 Tax=Mycena belliarum TaxID=1033014 RepID=A0AAD6XNA2_9AGAR|nr:hypothetical protein B0H15DRAFT_950519 [Mycena belliae]